MLVEAGHGERERIFIELASITEHNTMFFIFHTKAPLKLVIKSNLRGAQHFIKRVFLSY